jgi:hypothetical protein
MITIFTRVLSLVPTLSQVNLVHNNPSNFIKILSNIIISCMSRSSKCILPSGFYTKILYASLSSSMDATWSIYPILFDLSILIMLWQGVQIVKLLIVVSVTLSLWRTNILTSSVYALPLMWETYAKQEESWDSTVGIVTGYRLED